MAKVTLDAQRRVFANLKALIFTPWETETTLGTTDYDIVNIVADTTSMEQADNEVNAIDHEFSNEPLYENVNLGEKTFSCECIDFQNEVLKTMFGWTIVGDDAFAPIVYKDLYCKVEMHFNSTDDIIVFPKVKLNSKAVIASMKTDVSRANLTGTCYSAWVNIANKSYDTDMALISKTTGANGYSVTAEALNPANV